MGKRSTLNASDILKAVDDLELPGFADLLRSNLQGRSTKLRQLGEVHRPSGSRD